MDVVRGPLTGQPAGRTREPVVVEGAFRWAERADGVPAEEVALLVDVAARETSGCAQMASYHQVVPAFWAPMPTKSGGPVTSSLPA